MSEGPIKPLVWRQYSLPHDYGRGSWEANGIHGTYTILDVGLDVQKGLRYYLRGYSQFDPLEGAQAEAQRDHNGRIIASLTEDGKRALARLDTAIDELRKPLIGDLGGEP